MPIGFFTRIQEELVRLGFQLTPVSDIEYAYSLETHEHLVARGALVTLRDRLREHGYHHTIDVEFRGFVGELWHHNDSADVDIALLYRKDSDDEYVVMVKYWWAIRTVER